MHEAAIAQQVIDVCADEMRARGGLRATAVGLRVGALASVDPEALAFSFDALKQDTPLSAAILRIEWRSRFGCACATTPVDLFEVAGRCPSCGAAESFGEACALDIRFLEFETGDEP